MTGDSKLPEWNTIVDRTAEHLSAARNELSEAANWMRSDWSPLGTALSDKDAEARTKVFEAVTRLKGDIDYLKNLLQR